MTGRILAFGLGLTLALGTLALAAPKAEQVPPLVEKLKKSKDPKERADAAREICHIGQVKAAFTKPAVPALVEALKDSDAGVRREVAITLGEIKADPRLVVQPLTDALKDKDNGVRTAVAESLAYFGGQAKVALPALEEIQKEMNALTKEQQQQNGQLIQAVNQAIDAIKQAK
jgi:HEAT repeat protein